MKYRGLRRLFSILILGLLSTLIGVACTQQPASTPTSFVITVTGLSELNANLTRLSEPRATIEAYETTRTAIALIRQPQLAQTATPNDLQLTASQISSQDDLTASSQPDTPDMMQTATAIVQQVTETSFALTQSPDLALTTQPSLTSTPCMLSLETLYDSDTYLEIRAAFEEAGTEIPSILIENRVIASGGENCEYSEPLSTKLSFAIEVRDLEDEEALTERVEQVLEILTTSPSLAAYAPEITRLSIAFVSATDMQRRFIETGYDNAMQAYVTEGLRGEALIEALGMFAPPIGWSS